MDAGPRARAAGRRGAVVRAAGPPGGWGPQARGELSEEPYRRRRDSRRVMQSAVVFVIAIVATGCAHALSQPMPDLKGQLAVKVLNEQPSTMNDMPLGVYQIPDTSVYVSGHQGASNVGLLFGIIGVAAAHAAAQSTGEKKTQEAQAHLRIDLRMLTEEALTQELARRADGRFVPPDGARVSSLEVIPYVVVNFIGEDKARFWVVLKTALKDASGDQKWKTRYHAGVGEARPLTGEGGWASDDGAPVREVVRRNLRLAVDALLRDASGGLPRGTGRTVLVKTQWVWMKPFFERNAEVLEETEDALTVVPDAPDGFVFAGVNILDKKSITVTPAEKK